MRGTRRIKTSFLVPLVITIIIATLVKINPPIIDEYLETLLATYRFKIRQVIAPQPVPDDVVIVSVDEKSLSRHGRWPWSRTIQADLLDEIFTGGPRAVAVDIFYPEEESPEADKALAEVMNAHRDRLVVALGFEVEEGKISTGEVSDILFDQAVAKIENFNLLRSFNSYRVLLPPEPIAGSAEFGHVYTLSDRNGVLMWEFLYVKYSDEYFLSLAVKAAAAAMGVDPADIRIVGGEGVELGDIMIPSDAFGRLHINYYGRELTFPYASASDVLSGEVPKDFFKDKIVLVGTSAMGTYDQKVTPLSANMPGVEKNATVTANIIAGNFMRRSELYVDIVAVLLCGAAALLIGRSKRALHSFLYFNFLLFFVFAVNMILFMLNGIRANLFYPLFTVLSIGAFTIGYKYLVEERKARQIRKMFSSYVTERVVNELIKNPDMARLGGERRQITVLFSDISGFTPYSEKHAPEEVVAILNEYLGAMTDVIFRWEGTLDKFIGDAIVAFWGAPLEQKNHAELAVRCALNMIQRLEELKQKWISEGKEPLSTGIGVNTGEVIVGNIGAEGKKMDYTVIGDPVNIGARVETLTRKFSTNILITELPLNEIQELVKSNMIGHVSINGVGKVMVKGKEEPVKVYEVKALDSSEESVISECKEKTVIHMTEK
jgi:adenylate cyclase